MRRRKNSPPSAFSEILSMIGRNNIITHAGAADYFVFISLIPLFMITVALLRFLPLDKREILTYISTSLPDAIESVVSRLMNSVYYGATAAITVSIFLTIFTASAAMRAVMRALNSVYGDEREPSLLRFWLRSCVYMLIFTALVILCFALLVYGSRLWSLLHTLLPENTVAEAIFGAERYLHYVPILAILTLGFIAMYCVLPSGRHLPQHQWVGALFSACSWLAFSWLFSLYIDLSGKFGAYGYIGSLMVAMMWMYYCLMFFLIGGCINRYIELKSLNNA